MDYLDSLMCSQHLFFLHDALHLDAMVSSTYKLFFYITGKIFITIMAIRQVKRYYVVPPAQPGTVQRKMVTGTVPQPLPARTAKSRTKDGTMVGNCDGNVMEM